MTDLDGLRRILTDLDGLRRILTDCDGFRRISTDFATYLNEVDLMLNLINYHVFHTVGPKGKAIDQIY